MMNILHIIIKNYKLYIITALLSALVIMYVSKNNIETEFAQYKQKISNERAKNILQTRALERLIYDKNNKIEQTYSNAQKNTEINYADIINRVRNDDISVLNDRSQSIKTNTTTSAASGGDDRTRSKLSRTDIENIFRIAKNGDDSIRQLQACQSVIRNYQSINLYEQIE